MIKYIPSVSGAEYVVKVSLSPKRIRKLKFPSNALAIELYIDGKFSNSTVWEKKDKEDFITFETLIVATPTGPFIKPFLFSKIVISKSGLYH